MLISVKGLSVSYEKKRVLTNIFLDIEPGNIYGIIGPNGAGKSTLFNAMLGLIEMNTGEISYNGQPVTTQRARIAYVPQKNEVDWTFPATVMDVVLMGRYPHKRLFQQINKNDIALARHALAEMGIEVLENRQIGELSGGQQQRVFLARALCQEPEIIFMDEPFVGVDVVTEERIMGILKQLAAEGKTILVVHHDLSSVRDYFTKVILLNQRLIACGDTSEVFNDENIAKAYRAQLSVLNKMGMLDH